MPALLLSQQPTRQFFRQFAVVPVPHGHVQADIGKEKLHCSFRREIRKLLRMRGRYRSGKLGKPRIHFDLDGSHDLSSQSDLI